MKYHKIKLSETDSVNSVNEDNFVDVDIKQTTKLLPYDNVRETIDQREVFESERENCNQYRLILTINPFCTNVLFNTLTEIIKNEGSGNVVEVIIDNESYSLTDSNEIMGKSTNIDRNHMIMNTEYSKEGIDYVYHPGFDIFNNHILRNLSFKMVNKISNNVSGKNIGKWVDFDNTENSTPDVKQAFNTIGDFLRDKDGTIIQYRKRKGIDANKQKTDLTTDLNKHLYLYDDILGMANGDSINNNLREDNGWFGFINNSSISSKKRTNNTSSEWDDMDISRVMNNKKNCEFVDMYPDRTLYSFNPKYNDFRHRAEYNWNICLTYPFRNEYNHPIISNISNGDGRTNALKIMSVSKVNGLNDNTVLLIRTYSRHGLKLGDNIYFYYSDNGGSSYNRTSTTYKITNIGDLNKNNKEYYFYLTDINLIREVLGEDYWYNETGNFVKSDSDINAKFSNIDFRFTHVVNGVESEYYFRIFRKLPNLRKIKELLTKEIAENNEEYIKYTKNNCTEDGRLIDFNKEQYQLAFASTIYNDNCTQITFTDGLNIEYLVDNLGRPLTELYVTIVKNNAGNIEWYSKSDYTNENVEFSHCFGKVISGLIYHTEETDNGNSLLHLRGNMSDVMVINNSSYYSSKSIGEYIDVGNEKNNGIKYTDDEFIGDLVEFIPCRAQENILDDVYHRFNTVQREMNSIENPNEDAYSKFQYQEITADDYDLEDFTITNNTINNNINRPEGYYYKAHYEIPVRNFGDIQQSSHFDIKILKATPVQLDGIYIQLTSSLKSGVSVGDVIYICDDALNKWYESNVIYVIDNNNFVISCLNDMNWIKTCDILNNSDENKKFKVRRKNTDIPSYATKIGNNTFLWRNVIKVGDINSTIPEYIFANGYFYINKDINFFLKRQDPFDKNGLYAISKNIFPNDIYGNVRPTDNYVYKDESEVIC